MTINPILKPAELFRNVGVARADEILEAASYLLDGTEAEQSYIDGVMDMTMDLLLVSERHREAIKTEIIKRAEFRA